MTSYCTVTDVKSSLPDVEWGSNYDLLLDGLSERASRLIDVLVGRKANTFYIDADSIIYLQGDGSCQLWVELAQEPTEVAVAETFDLSAYTVWAASDYISWPYDEYPRLRLDISPYGTKSYWPTYPKAIKITGRCGFSIVPPGPIVEATIIQTSRWFKRGQQAFQDTGAIIDLGQLKYVQKLDPDISTIIQSSFSRMAI